MDCRDSRLGQASVETVALLPALVVLAVAAWQGLLVAWAMTAAGHAAGAGAHAVLAGAAVRPAVERALPAAMRPGLELRVESAFVRVRVRVPSLLPGVDPHVEAGADVVPR